MKKPILVALGLVIIAVGGIIASVEFKVPAEEELEGTVQEAHRQVIYVGPEVPEDIYQEGAKIFVEYTTESEEEDSQVMVFIMETPTFKDWWTRKVYQGIPVLFDEVKAQSIAWMVGRSGELEVEVPKTSPYTVAAIPYETDAAIEVEGEVVRDRTIDYPHYVGYLLIGALIAVKGFLGRLTP
ncbi:MAG: hypothetical protein ACE5PO_00115 [Candidatus Bathyarchaeia archaeon]